HSSPSQHHQHQQASSSQHHQQSVSQHREHQRSHSQSWDFLHTQQSINSTNEWSSSPYFHHEHAHHSQQDHESHHHFCSSSIEQSEHNFLSQNHHILTHNQANHTPRASNYNLHNSQRTSSENVHNPHPSYENSSNLPPRLSQAGFGNPQGENVDEDGDIDLNQFRQNTENHTSRNHPQEHTNRPLAWGWTEPPEFRPYTMRAPQRCLMCDAILLTGETNSLCCQKGRITLQQPPPPPE
ncbi:hypothetical protein MJO28_014742, partial [Puccinia striiformis f. sp. tritici]